MAMIDPPHPGRSIRKNCLEPLGLSVTEAARVLGVARHTLSRVLNGHSAISLEMALRLEKAGWSTAEFWLRRQTTYDLVQGVQDPGQDPCPTTPAAGSSVRKAVSAASLGNHTPDQPRASSQEALRFSIPRHRRTRLRRVMSPGIGVATVLNRRVRAESPSLSPARFRSGFTPINQQLIGYQPARPAMVGILQSRKSTRLSTRLVAG